MKLFHSLYLPKAYGLLILISMLIVIETEVKGQSSPKEFYQKALAFDAKQRFDSVMSVTSEGLALIEISGEDAFEWKMRMQLLRLTVIERTSDFGPVVEQLLALIDESEKRGLPDVALNGRLLLALVQEKLGRGDQCLTQLNAATELAKRYELDSLRGAIAVRKSSFHRFYGSQDSIKYYAEEAINLGQKSKTIADGHLMMRIYYLIIGDNEAALAELYKEGAIHRAGDKFDNIAWYYISLCFAMRDNGDMNAAMMFADSALFYYQIALDRGLDNIAGRGVFNRVKGDLFRQQGALDSALIYQERSFQAKLQEAERKSRDKVAAIEAEYNLEQKITELAQKDAELGVKQREANIRNAILIAVLLLAGILIYLVVKLRRNRSKLQSRTQQLKSALDTQLMLQGEIHHRVKNNLQIIISLLDLQAEELDSPEAKERLESMAGRIYSIAAIHEILHQSRGEDLVNLELYISKLCQQFKMTVGDQHITIFNHEIAPINLNLETLMPIGIIINELMNNSFKYGRCNEGKLLIDMRAVLENELVTITYRDSGPGYPSGEMANKAGSLGHYLLESMTRQVNGKLTTFNEAGAAAVLSFKLSNIY